MTILLYHENKKANFTSHYRLCDYNSRNSSLNPIFSRRNVRQRLGVCGMSGGADFQGGGADEMYGLCARSLLHCGAACVRAL